MLAGRHGEAVRRALQYQIDVGRFWGASRFVPVTNVHMMGDIEVMGDAGLEYLREEVRLGARCRVSATTNARCIDFAHCERIGQDAGAVGKIVGEAHQNSLAVPVFHGCRRTEGGDELKPLGAALASYGSMAMFHFVGVTPEAPSIEAVRGNKALEQLVIGDSDIEKI